MILSMSMNKPLSNDGEISLSAISRMVSIPNLSFLADETNSSIHRSLFIESMDIQRGEEDQRFISEKMMKKKKKI